MKGLKGIGTRNLIREAAFKLFLTNDYGTVSLRDIEKVTRTTRGCTSYHYANKQELFIDVIDYYIFHRQDVKNKDKTMLNLPLLGFIDVYIEKVMATKETLELFLMPGSETNITRAYMNLILQAERYYPDFNIFLTRIGIDEINIWKQILSLAVKRGEIKKQKNIVLLAQQFRCIFLGRSYMSALVSGLSRNELQEQLYYQYELIRKNKRKKVQNE